MALSGLLVIQVYWFLKAYNIQERQFDETAILAIRSVTNRMLRLETDDTTRLAPVEQTSSNSFYVDFNRNISYRVVDSVVTNTFREHGIYYPFELVVYDDVTNGVMFGNFYKDGVMSDAEPTCLTRIAPNRATMDFVITFPGKRVDIVGAMGIWIFSAFTFLLILIVFGFVIVNLSRQKRLSELKSDFMNNMTHELQTPITNISIASEVLQKATGHLDHARAVQYANIIYVENQRLRFQVEQVLQTALLERGEIDLKKQEININTLVEEVIGTFRLRIQSRDGQIVSRLCALRPTIFGDHFHLTNILYSLLDNADKYSTATPEITITTSDDEKGVRVAIADKGIGINEDVQRFIFDRFYRVATDNINTVRGFGLGLTYVREIVAAHRGRVSVSSHPGQGSCFELFFQNR
jgi:two-component system phosphate regulon sensor histidine kinase PhoR